MRTRCKLDKIPSLEIHLKVVTKKSNQDQRSKPKRETKEVGSDFLSDPREDNFPRNSSLQSKKKRKDYFVWNKRNKSKTRKIEDKMSTMTGTQCTSVKEFYRDRSIFITGGTGFMGKVLVEKLLRSCPGIKNIYLLMRPKRGQGVQQRLKQLLDGPVR